VIGQLEQPTLGSYRIEGQESTGLADAALTQRRGSALVLPPPRVLADERVVRDESVPAQPAVQEFPVHAVPPTP
jgi:hypothetical protein